jgi:hypothetical protein
MSVIVIFATVLVAALLHTNTQHAPISSGFAPERLCQREASLLLNGFRLHTVRALLLLRVRPGSDFYSGNSQRVYY